MIDLQRFAANLETAWQAGEKRATHRRPYRRTKPYPKRGHMLDPFEAQIRVWLEADPAISAAAVLERLMNADPSRFTLKSARTVQKAVKVWRAEITGQIILGGDWMKSLATSPPAAAGGDVARLFIQSPPRMICPVISARHTFTAFCTVLALFSVKRDGSAFMSRSNTAAAEIAGSASSQTRI